MQKVVSTVEDASYYIGTVGRREEPRFFDKKFNRALALSAVRSYRLCCGLKNTILKEGECQGSAL